MARQYGQKVTEAGKPHRHGRADAKERRASIGAQGFGARAPKVRIAQGRIKSDRGQVCPQGRPAAVKSAKRWQTGYGGIARTASRKPVPGQGAQTTDHGKDAAKDDEIAAPFGQNTDTGVPIDT